MEIFGLIIILVIIFAFFIYLPTHYLVKKQVDKKDEYESLLIFISMSLLFLLFCYLVSSYYLLNSVTGVTECNGILNLVCTLNSTLFLQVETSLKIYVMIFLELIIYFTYSYFSVLLVCNYRNKKRRVMNMFLFFIVSIVATLIHVAVLSDVAFVGGVEYISLFALNVYFVLPLFYMLIFVGRFLGNKEIKVKRKKKARS